MSCNKSLALYGITEEEAGRDFETQRLVLTFVLYLAQQAKEDKSLLWGIWSKDQISDDKGDNQGFHHFKIEHQKVLSLS